MIKIFIKFLNIFIPIVSIREQMFEKFFNTVNEISNLISCVR